MSAMHNADAPLSARRRTHPPRVRMDRVTKDRAVTATKPVLLRRCPANRGMMAQVSLTTGISSTCSLRCVCNRQATGFRQARPECRQLFGRSTGR